MDIILVCHTEFGMVKNRKVVADRRFKEGALVGITNLLKICEKYGVKATLAVMPEVAEYLPKKIDHEVALHIHPGWQEFRKENDNFFIGDKFLREHCRQSFESTFLCDYSYAEQREMIEQGKRYLENIFDRPVVSFVAGRWSLNSDTVRALVDIGITHDCSAPAHLKSQGYDWSRLPRICLPYHPASSDYQQRGELPFLIVPISQFLLGGNVNPEAVIEVGSGWLNGCFLEYYQQDLPLFHICLHSPCLLSTYFYDVLEKFLGFIVRHRNIKFKFASEIHEYDIPSTWHAKDKILPYLVRLNSKIICSGIKTIVKKTKLWPVS